MQTKKTNSLRGGQNRASLSKNLSFILILLAILLLMSLISLRAGSYDTPSLEILRGVFGRAADSNINTIIRRIRLPRIATALSGGAALGITGCVLQSVLHNPLASASTLGISQGASFGAAFAIIVLGAGVQSGSAAVLQFQNPMLISLCAFLCSISVSALLLALSRFRSISPQAMILAGVALSSIFTGATTLLQFFASETQLTSLIFWTFGDLGRTGWREIAMIAAVTVLASIYFFLNRWKYNALEVGENTAISLGVNVNRFRIINMLLCSIAASIIVSFAGIIQFIGLIAPHIIRRIIGSNHTFLLPASAITGSILLLIGDLLARRLMSPVILPIGAITSFFGAPLFLYLLLKKNKD